MKNPARVAVFASGGGTNLQALLDHFNARASEVARIELVVASRGGIGAIERARRAGVSVLVLDPAAPASGDLEEVTLAALAEHRIDLIVLAGYLKLVPTGVVERYSGRMLNIHPALLPAFGGPGMYGLRVHAAVLASGARVSGATVHQVNERYDEGEIVAQWPVPVLATDSPESLAARVLAVEHLLLPLAIESLLGRYEDEPEPGQSFALTEAVVPDPGSVRRLIH